MFKIRKLKSLTDGYGTITLINIATLYILYRYDLTSFSQKLVDTLIFLLNNYHFNIYVKNFTKALAI